MIRRHPYVARLALLAVLLFAGCVSTSIDQQAREAVAAGYALVETTADTARTLHDAGLIPDSRRAIVKDRLTAALAALGAAQRALAAQQWALARRQALKAVAPVRVDLEQLQEVRQ